MASSSINPVPSNVKDLTGLSFDRWTVLSFSHTAKRSFWTARCACGTQRVVEGGALTTGKSRSCGCLHREVSSRVASQPRTHGMKGAPEYYVWTSLKQRCLNPLVKNYAAYGGRGITVCSRWAQSFEAFIADMGERPSPRHSIDRIDNDGNYEPGNCEWKDFSSQVRNRRSNVVVQYRGQEMVLTDAVRLAGACYSTVHRRMSRGQSFAEAIENTHAQQS